MTPWNHLGGAVAFLCAGVGLSGAWMSRPGLVTIPALVIGWLLTLHGARKLRTVIMHQAAHHNFIRHRAFDRWLGKSISILLVSEEFDGYRRSHCGDHHSSSHQTPDDPTVAFLFDELALRPGMAKREMWRRLFVTVLSPVYHARFLWARLSSHFRGTSTRHRLAFSSFAMAAILLTTWLGLWPILVVSWLIPVGILYQVSTAFRLSSEHVFPQRRLFPGERAHPGAYTVAIFIGAPCPSGTAPMAQRWAAWLGWWARMLLFHLPCRLAFLPGDGPVHDWHHRHPVSPDWANYIAQRATSAATLRPDDLPYREVWGFQRAIDACFTSLSEADPTDYAEHVWRQATRPQSKPQARILVEG